MISLPLRRRAPRRFSLGGLRRSLHLPFARRRAPNRFRRTKVDISTAVWLARRLARHGFRAGR